MQYCETSHPIELIKPDLFRDVCFGLLSRVYPESDIHAPGFKHGGQIEIDFIIDHPDGRCETYNCSVDPDFNGAKLKELVANQQLFLDKHFILLSHPCPHSARVEEENHEDWEIIDIYEINRIIYDICNKQRIKEMDNE